MTDIIDVVITNTRIEKFNTYIQVLSGSVALIQIDGSFDITDLRFTLAKDSIMHVRSIIFPLEKLVFLLLLEDNGP